MPFLFMFKNHGNFVCYIFLIGLISTMISTAETCLIGVKNKIKVQNKNERFVKIIVILLSLILGQIKFGFFIKIVYPIIAIMNLYVFFYEIFVRKKSKKNQ